jgi:7,8-dihydro-6-hydroxymethylpterin dimethyltransferase
MGKCLSQDEIKKWHPYKRVNDGLTATERTRARLEKNGQWAPWQMMGRRMSIGCVALEITQRCNLDCTYCYLSESSEALKDIPLKEVFRRIDEIFEFYGPNTDVQVSGGDPTLRQRDELVAIVRYIKETGMRSSLFTNGIRATREMLEELVEAGLEDVAFHVDMTQERKGYQSEVELNAVRLEYINRARGLPLSVIFNTTAFPGNFHEIPDVVRFFQGHADVVRFVSVQVGAEVGRGVDAETDRERVTVNFNTVKQAICEGAGTQLNFDAASSGHRDCNAYAFGLIVNGKVFDFLYDSEFVQKTLHSSVGFAVNRANLVRMWLAIGRYFASHPSIFLGFAKRAFQLAWRERQHFVAARGRVHKLSYFVHNFMDASALDEERCEACSFMVMTPEGPLSMCIHNAKRDDYLLVPAAVKQESKLMFFNPVTGGYENQLPKNMSVLLNRKNARGSAKQTLQGAQKFDEFENEKPVISASGVAT